MDDSDSSSLSLEQLIKACQTNSLSELLKQQSNDSSPTLDWPLITKHLLSAESTDDDNDKISSKDAFQVVISLVQLDPSKYLLDLSKSVLQHVTAVIDSDSSNNANPNSIMVSPELLAV